MSIKRHHRFEPTLNLEPETRNTIDLCGRCKNYGIWLTPKGVVSECPNLQLGFNDHRPLNDAAKIVLARARSMSEERGITVERQHVFSLACALTKTTTGHRLTSRELIARFFEWGGSQKLRHFALAIEELRSVWLLPVCSSRGLPYGYWIATDAKDFLAWVDESKAAPFKYLQTVARVAAANFRGLQLDLDFSTASDSDRVEAPEPQFPAAA